MTRKVWGYSLVTVILLAGLAVAFGGGAAMPIKSEHARPAAVLPASEVAVSSYGKLFHDPACPYIHGKPELMSAAEAQRLGYTPCPRCMKKALGR